MKKLFLFITMLALMHIVNAQSKTILIGGNFNFNTRNSVVASTATYSGKTVSLGFRPYIGYQFTDHLTAGIQGSIGMDTYDYDNTSISTEKANSYYAGPFVRYTIPLSNIFSIYGQLEGNYQSGSRQVAGEVVKTSQWNGISINVFPAVFVNVKNNFGLNFSFGGLSYGSWKYKMYDYKNNSFGINLGSTLNIGISKNF